MTIRITLLITYCFNIVENFLYLRDGTKVTELMTAVLMTYWNPKPGSKGTCVAFQNLKLVNVPCDNSNGYFYDFNKDGDASINTKSILGYLCETRCHIHRPYFFGDFSIKLEHFTNFWYL